MVDERARLGDCQRGLNERINGLIIQYLPKKRRFDDVTDEDIALIEKKLNNRPRKMLGFKMPKQQFQTASRTPGRCTSYLNRASIVSWIDKDRHFHSLFSSRLFAYAQTPEQSPAHDCPMTSHGTIPRDGLQKQCYTMQVNEHFKGFIGNVMKAGKELLMTRINNAAIILILISALPMGASAQSSGFGPDEGDREFSISGTGSSDRDFESGTFGMSGDMGWYLSGQTVAGIRQSVNYASIEGASIDDDFWNGSTRGYINYQFLDNKARPFVGASLGGIYGDGVKDSGFAGVETGLKYYVRSKTYFLARVDYQFFFDDTDDADDAFQDDGAWAYTVGLGYNF